MKKERGREFHLSWPSHSLGLVAKTRQTGGNTPPGYFHFFPEQQKILSFDPTTYTFDRNTIEELNVECNYEIVH
jgi:hypothetical protein